MIFFYIRDPISIINQKNPNLKKITDLKVYGNLNEKTKQNNNCDFNSSNERFLSKISTSPS